GRAPLVSRPVCVDLERQLDRIVERRELAWCLAAPVRRLFQHRRLEPLAYRVARQTRQPHDLPNRLLLAEMHPLDLANHGHGAHLCKMSLATTETAGVASHSSSLASSELSTAATPTPTEADAIDLTHTPRSDATALASAMMPPPAKAPATKTATGVRRLRN